MKRLLIIFILGFVISIVLIGTTVLFIPNEKLRALISLVPLSEESLDHGMKIKKEVQLRIKNLSNEAKLFTENLIGLSSSKSYSKVVINLNQITDDRKKSIKNNDVAFSKNELREPETKLEQPESLPVPLIAPQPIISGPKDNLSTPKKVRSSKSMKESKNLVATNKIDGKTANLSHLAPAPEAIPIEKVIVAQLPNKKIPDAVKMIAKNSTRNETVKKTAENNKNTKIKPPPVAPKTGDSSEEHKRGLAYYQGNGVAKDLKTARKWFLKAAEKNNPAAQYNLGIMSYTGQGIKQDFKKAAEWFRLAANQDHALAQYNLGFLYYEGKGIKKDPLQAFMWIDRAANQGDEKAIKALAILEKSLPKDIYKKKKTP